MDKYLYNGIELPTLEDWDKTIYPYAYIGTHNNSRYYVHYSTQPFFVKASGHAAPIINCTVVAYLATTSSEQWNRDDEPFEANSDSACANPIWATYDMYYMDDVADVGGTVCIPASEYNVDSGETEDETVPTTPIPSDAYIVKGGKLYKVKGCGSSGALPEVELTTPVENGTTFTAEENAALSAALATGKPVIVKSTIMETPGVVMVMNNFAGQGFVAVYANYNFLLMDTGEGWSALIEEMRVLPEATEEDEGKFVQVVGGAYELVALQDVSKEGA